MIRTYTSADGKRSIRVSNKPVLTSQLARTVSIDAANRQMRSQNRTEWNEDDWNKACEVYRKLILEQDIIEATE